MQTENVGRDEVLIWVLEVGSTSYIFELLRHSIEHSLKHAAPSFVAEFSFPLFIGLAS